MKYRTSILLGFFTLSFGHAESMVHDLETRPLSLRSITATDYPEILKLLTPVSLRLKEVHDLESSGFLIGVVANKDEVALLEPIIYGLNKNYLLRPNFVIKSSGGVWDKNSQKPMVLVNLSIESITPPNAVARVYIITGPDAKDTKSIELLAVKTRSGWIEDEIKTSNL